MNQKIKLVVFDMAGTTIDEDNVVYKTIQNTLNQYNFNFTLTEVLVNCAGKEKRQAIKDVLRFKDIEQTDEQINTIFESFKENLKEAYATLTVKSFKGVEELFTTLKEKQIKIALNTGYDLITAKSLLNNLNWKEGVEFDTLVTADDVEKGRPFPDMIYKAMDRTGITSSEHVAKIGDSIVDIAEGKSANCKYTIGVTTGAQNRNQLQTANPTYIFDQLSELLNHI
ncbi:phosphonatase-like hydrolase [Crocinitomix algicola]|uniref:phosphonatase-like hydrolase n=1 Tax=Crocinitomix algicola TaxID=1740263 RepID=UPI000833B05E|nr:phosphonatase-like hydrolase [Crocinitomix algicola]